MSTISEEYVNFEIAKLLREKGFDADIDLWYDENGKMFYKHKYDISSDWRTKAQQKVYLCPTLQMTMKWLREVHHLVIQIELIDFLEHGEVWVYSIIERKTIKRLTNKDEDFTEHSYEESCESAIKYCLENLI